MIFTKSEPLNLIVCEYISDTENIVIAAAPHGKSLTVIDTGYFNKLREAYEELQEMKYQQEHQFDADVVYRDLVKGISGLSDDFMADGRNPAVSAKESTV